MDSFTERELEKIREQAIAVLAQFAGTDTETIKQRIQEQGFDVVQKQIVDLDKIYSHFAKRIAEEMGLNYEVLKEAEREQRLREAKDKDTVRRLSESTVVQRPLDPPASKSMIAECDTY